MVAIMITILGKKAYRKCWVLNYLDNEIEVSRIMQNAQRAKLTVVAAENLMPPSRVFPLELTQHCAASQLPPA